MRSRIFVRWYVRPWVGPSVRQSVRRSVGPTQVEFRTKMEQNSTKNMKLKRDVTNTVSNQA